VLPSEGKKKKKREKETRKKQQIARIVIFKA
jgi:hypothetical protein